MPLAPSAGVREAVERVATSAPRAKVPVERIADAVLAARWGGGRLDRQKSRELLQSLEAALRP